MRIRRRTGWLTTFSASLVVKPTPVKAKRAWNRAVCDRPREVIVPYVKRPEDILPGKTLTYATAMESEDGAVGLLVKSHMGRPIKVEGNPDHPANLGTTDAVAQASILSLYDPDRSQVLRHLGQISTRSLPEDALELG